MTLGMSAERYHEMQLKEMENIEDQIRELERSRNVKLAREYNDARERRLAYLQELKQLDRQGKRLAAMGWRWTPDAED